MNEKGVFAFGEKEKVNDDDGNWQHECRVVGSESKEGAAAELSKMGICDEIVSSSEKVKHGVCLCWIRWFTLRKVLNNFSGV